jgi:hypothetical protein
MIGVKRRDFNGTYIHEPLTVKSDIPNLSKISAFMVDGSGLTLENALVRLPAERSAGWLLEFF